MREGLWVALRNLHTNTTKTLKLQSDLKKMATALFRAPKSILKPAAKPARTPKKTLKN
jgi:ribosomal protein L13E